MAEESGKIVSKEEEEAEVLIWKYAFGFVEIAVIKCAVELGIAETIDTNGKPMSLTELSDALGCSSAYLHRIMRFLAHQKIFKEICTSDGSKTYALTPLSRLLMKHEERSKRSLFLLHSSPPMLAAWHHLSRFMQKNGPLPFEAAHGVDLWGFTAGNPEDSQLFDDAMACDTRISVPALIDGCAEIFNGVNTIVDVGGGNGTTLRAIIKAFPHIKGINFDLQHVVSEASKHKGIENVVGDMFESVPKADAVIIKWVLHDWEDDKCVRILKNCREAVANRSNGKVLIFEAVIKEDEDYKLKYVQFMLDMVMLAHTSNGKERTREEWGSILRHAGFSRFEVKPIEAVQSVIIAYP